MQQFPQGGLEQGSSRAKDCWKKGWRVGGAELRLRRVL